MQRESLDKFLDADKILTSVTRDLERLAYAFEEIGNEKVANDLWRAVEGVSTARSLAREARGETLTDAVRSSEAMTGSLLLAVMHGAIRPKQAAS